jgi:tetratricopeptide (TPR) repeat protein
VPFGEPYAPLLAALKTHIRAQPRERLRACLRDCAWLVRLLPELAEGPIDPLPPWTLPPDQERRLMFEAVSRFLANVAGEAAPGAGRGTLLLLDDLQWAGADALDLLATVARAGAEAPLRVVGAYRDTEVSPDDPLSVVLADLAHAGLAIQRTLGPLTAEESTLLLDGLLAGAQEGETALRARVVQRTGGVPFFVVSCAQELRVGALAGGGDNAVPWTVAQSVRQRVAALPEAAREVLSAAAVVGRAVPRALLEAVAARPEEEMLAALEAACRARLLDEAGADAYQFAHDVIREVVEAGLSAARRRALHQRVAEALERAEGEPPVEALAYHYVRAGVQGRAVLYLERAGDRSRAQYAHAVAEDYYREAADRLEALARAQDAARVREKLGRVLRTAGRFDAALEALEQAARTYQETGDLQRLGAVSGYIGEVHGDRGTAAEALSRFQPLLTRLEEAHAWQGLASLCLAVSELLWHAGRHAEQLAVAERASALFRELGDDALLADAEMRRGYALLNMDREEEALPVLEEAMRLATAAGDRTTLAWALNIVGCVHGFKGDFAAQIRYCERALAQAEMTGNPVARVIITSARGWTAYFTGDWARARADSETALAALRDVGRLWQTIGPLLNLGQLCLVEGSVGGAAPEAERYGHDALQLAEQSGTVPEQFLAQNLLAECDLLAGRTEAARERLAPRREGAVSSLWRFTPAPVVLARVHLALGEVDLAAAVVAQVVAGERARQHRPALCEALWVRALVAIRQERWAEAEQALREGLELARTIGFPYAEARLLHAWGTLHARRMASPADREQARGRLMEALALFQRLGACGDAEQVARDCRVL